MKKSLIDTYMAELKREDLQCKVYPLGELKTYKYVVVCAFFRGSIC